MRNKFKIYFNAPITLSFVGICLISLILGYVTNGLSTELLFSTYSTSLLDPLMYVRLIGHIFGHADIDHFFSNMLYILLLGPMLEEKYHSRIISVILATALTTGIIHNLFSPNVMLLGASGVVFAFILLSSITGKENGIPITLIFVAICWLGQEIYGGLVSYDNVSHITHIIGGISGAVLGIIFKDR